MKHIQKITLVLFVFTFVTISVAAIIGPAITENAVTNNKESASDQIVVTKNYIDTKYNFDFEYPSRLGNVLVEEGDSQGGRGGGSASIVGIVDSYDEKITFSNNQKSTEFSSSSPVVMEIYVVDLTKPVVSNLVFVPGHQEKVSLFEDKKYLQTKPDGIVTTDQGNYFFETYTTKKGLVVATNNGIGSMGTSFFKFYKVYGTDIALEIHVTYSPYYNSPEDKEMQEFQKGKTVFEFWGRLSDYLQTGKTSKKIRDVFREAEQIVESLNLQ